MKILINAYKRYAHIQGSVFESARSLLRKAQLKNERQKVHNRKKKQNVSSLVYSTKTVKQNEKLNKTKELERLTLKKQEKLIKDLQDTIFINKRRKH